MKRMLAIVVGVSLVLAARQAEGCGYSPSPALQFVQADCVVTGKVIAIETRKLMLRVQPNTPPQPHTVAVLKIDDAIKGGDRVTHLRLALAAHQTMTPVGFEGCFFLTAVADQPVFLMSLRWYDYPIQKENNPGFSKRVDEFKKLAQLLKDPQKGMKSQNASDRFLTAALLVTQLRTFQPERHVAADKTQPIDAELSKQILHTLAECDWNSNAADYRLTPWRVFSLLGATDKDGYKPQGGNHLVEAKRWLKESEETFRIKTFVSR